MQSCEVLLGKGFPEGLALLKGERELLLGRLAGTIGTGKCSSTPGGSTAELLAGSK